MTYKLTIRKFDESDVNLECKFLPSGELEIYAIAMIEEIDNANNIQNILLLKSSEDQCEIEIITDISLEELESLAFPIFTSDSFRCKLKYKDLQIVEK